VRTNYLVVAACAAVLLTGCSSSPESSTTSSPAGSSPGYGSPGAASASPEGSAGAVPGQALCQTEGLRITVDSAAASGAAGSTYVPVDFANMSSAACVLDGYPGVSFVTAADSSGRQIGAAAARNPQFGPVAVQLAPGASAHAWLQVAEAGNYPASSCGLVTAHGLRVYPPGSTEAGYVALDLPACSGNGVHQLTVMPVRAGKGADGSVP
jgi:hypothetical protein